MFIFRFLLCPVGTLCSKEGESASWMKMVMLPRLGLDICVPLEALARRGGLAGPETVFHILRNGSGVIEFF